MSTISIWGPTRENLSEKDAMPPSIRMSIVNTKTPSTMTSAQPSLLNYNEINQEDVTLVRGTLRRESRVLGIIGIDEKQIP